MTKAVVGSMAVKAATCVLIRSAAFTGAAPIPAREKVAGGASAAGRDCRYSMFDSTSAIAAVIWSAVIDGSFQ